MGYIDEATHTFFCPQCSIQEKIKIFDKGTMWSDPLTPRLRPTSRPNSTPPLQKQFPSS